MHYQFLNQLEQHTRLQQKAEDALDQVSHLIAAPQQTLIELGYKPSRREIQNVKQSVLDRPTCIACYFEFQKDISPEEVHSVDIYLSFIGKTYYQYNLYLDFSYQDDTTHEIITWSNDIQDPHHAMLHFTRIENNIEGYAYKLINLDLEDALVALRALPFNQEKV